MGWFVNSQFLVGNYVSNLAGKFVVWNTMFIPK